MNRGPGSLLTPEHTPEHAPEHTPEHAPERSAALEVVRPEATATGRRGVLRRTFAGFGDSCALVGVALLGCAGLVAVGTVGSLAWTFLVER
jgi:hypothetical protein